MDINTLINRYCVGTILRIATQEPYPFQLKARVDVVTISCKCRIHVSTYVIDTMLLYDTYLYYCMSMCVVPCKSFYSKNARHDAMNRGTSGIWHATGGAKKGWPSQIENWHCRHCFEFIWLHLQWELKTCSSVTKADEALLCWQPSSMCMV